MEFLTCHESWIKLHGKLVELAIEGVLHDVALSHAGEERDYFGVFEFVDVDGLVDLCQTDDHRGLHYLFENAVRELEIKSILTPPIELDYICEAAILLPPVASF